MILVKEIWFPQESFLVGVLIFFETNKTCSELLTGQSLENRKSPTIKIKYAERGQSKNYFN